MMEAIAGGARGRLPEMFGREDVAAVTVGRKPLIAGLYCWACEFRWVSVLRGPFEWFVRG
jgi:hypothetical protein